MRGGGRGRSAEAAECLQWPKTGVRSATARLMRVAGERWRSGALGRGVQATPRAERHAVARRAAHDVDRRVRQLRAAQRAAPWPLRAANAAPAAAAHGPQSQREGGGSAQACPPQSVNTCEVLSGSPRRAPRVAHTRRAYLVRQLRRRAAHGGSLHRRRCGAGGERGEAANGGAQHAGSLVAVSGGVRGELRGLLALLERARKACRWLYRQSGCVPPAALAALGEGFACAPPLQWMTQRSAGTHAQQHAARGRLLCPPIAPGATARATLAPRERHARRLRPASSPAASPCARLRGARAREQRSRAQQMLGPHARLFPRLPLTPSLCSICFEAAEAADLLCACACSGRLVHRACLRRWRIAKQAC